MRMFKKDGKKSLAHLLLGMGFGISSCMLGLVFFINLLQLGPESLLDSNMDRAFPDSNREWLVACNLLDELGGGWSANAGSYFDKGQCFSILAAIGDDESRNNEFIAKAKNAYLQALKLSPTWGLAWIRLASLYLKNPSERQLGMSTLANAIEYGDNELRVMTKIVHYSVAYWHLLGDRERARVLSVADKLMDHQTDYVVYPIVFFGRQHELRYLYADDPHSVKVERMFEKSLKNNVSR